VIVDPGGGHGETPAESSDEAGGAPGDIVLLAVASSRFELESIVALLRSCGIAVSAGPADHVRPWLHDNCIYVRRDELELARDLLDAPLPPEFR